MYLAPFGFLVLLQPLDGRHLGKGARCMLLVEFDFVLGVTIFVQIGGTDPYFRTNSRVLFLSYLTFTLPTTLMWKTIKFLCAFFFVGGSSQIFHQN